MSGERGRKKIRLIKSQYLCLHVASSETVDIRGQFGHIMKVNLSQPIIVKLSQLESQVIMTDRWKEGGDAAQLFS